MPDEAFKHARQSLADLRNKVDKDAEPLHAALLTLVTTLEKMHQIQSGNATPSLKTTQLKALLNHLAAGSHEVVETRDPGGSTIGNQIRTVLLDGEGKIIAKDLRGEALDQKLGTLLAK